VASRPERTGREGVLKPENSRFPCQAAFCHFSAQNLSGKSRFIAGRPPSRIPEIRLVHPPPRPSANPLTNLALFRSVILHDRL
jgi:hypothetical protein